MLKKLFVSNQVRFTSNIIQYRFASSHDGQTPSQDKTNNKHIPIIDHDDPEFLPQPSYIPKINEPLQQKKNRLLYQSRKRGMLENDLLLSTFAAKYLASMDEKQTEMYDNLINGPSNDWDIYYWAIGLKPTPVEYNSPIMDMFKEHVKNPKKEKRLQMPNL